MKVGVGLSWSAGAGDTYRFQISKCRLEFVWKRDPRRPNKYGFKYNSRAVEDSTWEDDARAFSKAMRRGAIRNGLKIVSVKQGEAARKHGYNDRYSVKLTPEAAAEDAQRSCEAALRRAAMEQAWLAFNPHLLTKVSELKLTVRAANCLSNENIVYVGDLARKSEAEVLSVPNVGRKTLAELNGVLALLDCHIGMKLPTE